MLILDEIQSGMDRKGLMFAGNGLAENRKEGYTRRVRGASPKMGLGTSSLNVTHGKQVIGLVAAFLLCGASTAIAGNGPSERFEKYRAAAQAARKANNCEEARKNWSAAVDESESFPLVDARRVSALTELALLQERLHDFAAAERNYGRALPTVTALKSRDPAVVGRFWRGYARLIGRMGDNEKAAQLGETAVAVLARAGDKGKLGTAYDELANFYNFLDRNDDSEAMRLKAVETLKKADEPLGLSIACENLAHFYSIYHRLNLAWEPYECAIAAAKKDSAGLITREHKLLLKNYSADLKIAGKTTEAAWADRALAEINASPPPSPTDCIQGLTVTKP